MPSNHVLPLKAEDQPNPTDLHSSPWIVIIAKALATNPSDKHELADRLGELDELDYTDVTELYEYIAAEARTY